MSKKWIVRHGSYQMLGEFEAGSDDFRKGQSILVQTERGTETGQILSESDEISRQWLTKPTSGKIIRTMSSADFQKSRDIKAQEEKALALCAHFASLRGTQLTLVDVEKLFGGERIIFYYLAEGRIDFRDLVKDLAQELRTRIEMRQIGVRDEAKLLADFGDCGKPVCCNSHLIEMPPVTMRMAKMQKATLDPTKLSGRCGRLKCCLRFEQDVYDLYQKELPEPGTLVATEKGNGRVLAQEILARKVLVEFEDGRRISLPIQSILQTKS